MSELVKELQEFLNDHGASLNVDGQGGKLTRAAVIDTFRNTEAAAVTDEDINRIANRLGGTAKQVRAVAKVESGAYGGWDNQGLLTALWERHWMWRRVRVKVAMLSSPKPGGYTRDVNRNGVNDSWEKLSKAAARWGLVAFECASFGRFQIMGGNAESMGYDSAAYMAWRMSREEAAHYNALAAFIEVNNLVGAFRALSSNPETCRAFARGYNGRRYRKYSYHTKLAAAMR